jgi:hypothetical protein
VYFFPIVSGVSCPHKVTVSIMIYVTTPEDQYEKHACVIELMEVCVSQLIMCDSSNITLATRHMGTSLENLTVLHMSLTAAHIISS